MLSFKEILIIAVAIFFTSGVTLLQGYNWGIKSQRESDLREAVETLKKCIKKNN